MVAEEWKLKWNKITVLSPKSNNISLCHTWKKSRSSTFRWAGTYPQIHLCSNLVKSKEFYGFCKSHLQITVKPLACTIEDPPGAWRQNHILGSVLYQLLTVISIKPSVNKPLEHKAFLASWNSMSMNISTDRVNKYIFKKNQKTFKYWDRFP